MAYLAKVARADAIAVILNMKGEGYVTYVAHNLPTETKWSEGLPSVMLAKAMSERATDQATSGVTLMLSDGRAADTLAVSPVIWKDQVVGGLAAMLVGRAFSAEDLASLGRVGDLIGLELAEANALWRADRQVDAALRSRAGRVRPDRERVDDRSPAVQRSHARRRQREASCPAGALRAGASRFAHASGGRDRFGVSDGRRVPARRGGSPAGPRPVRALPVRDARDRPAQRPRECRRDARRQPASRRGRRVGRRGASPAPAGRDGLRRYHALRHLHHRHRHRARPGPPRASHRDGAVR